MSRGVPEEEVLGEPVLSLPEIQQPAHRDWSRVRGYGFATRTRDLNRRRVYPGSVASCTLSIVANGQVRSLVIPRKGSRQSRNYVIQTSIRERKFESVETFESGDDLVARSKRGNKT